MKKNNSFQRGTSIFILSVRQFVSSSVRRGQNFDLYTFFHADRKGEEGGEKRLIKK